MKVEIDKLILNEVEVIEEMLNTGIVPQFYNTKNVLNRLYRYFEGNIDKVLPALEMLGIVVDKQYVQENVAHYTQIQPLTQNKVIEIYKSELQAIKKLKSRQTQRTVFGLLMLKKIVNEKCNRYDSILRLDSINEIFNYVNNVDSVKAEHDAWYTMQQSGIINVDYDCNIELKILEFDGEIVETITDNFDKCNYWFDKLFPAEQLETIIAVVDGEIEVYEHMGYRGTAKEFSEKHFKIAGGRIQECCTLKREQQKGAYFFVLDEELLKREGDYEIRREAFINTMIKARDVLVNCKRNPNKKKKLCVSVNCADGTAFTVRIK